jgi:hypothetical protein
VRVLATLRATLALDESAAQHHDQDHQDDQGYFHRACSIVSWFVGVFMFAQSSVYRSV